VRLFGRQLRHVLGKQLHDHGCCSIICRCQGETVGLIMPICPHNAVTAGLADIATSQMGRAREMENEESREMTYRERIEMIERLEREAAATREHAANLRAETEFLVELDKLRPAEDDAQ